MGGRHALMLYQNWFVDCFLPEGGKTKGLWDVCHWAFAGEHSDSLKSFFSWVVSTGVPVGFSQPTETIKCFSY